MMTPKAILAKALVVIPIPALEITQTLQRRRIPAMTTLLTKVEILLLQVTLARLIQEAMLEQEVTTSKTLKLILMIPVLQLRVLVMTIRALLMILTVLMTAMIPLPLTRMPAMTRA